MSGRAPCRRMASPRPSRIASTRPRRTTRAARALTSSPARTRGSSPAFPTNPSVLRKAGTEDRYGHRTSPDGGPGSFSSGERYDALAIAAPASIAAGPRCLAAPLALGLLVMPVAAVVGLVGLLVGLLGIALGFLLGVSILVRLLVRGLEPPADVAGVLADPAAVIAVFRGLGALPVLGGLG